MNLRSIVILIATVIWTLVSCQNKSNDQAIKAKVITDLPFTSATHSKEYADIVIKSIKTNRHNPVAAEFINPSDIDLSNLKKIVNLYSSGIGGRDDWEFVDIYETSMTTTEEKGYDYVWLDPKGKLGLQIYVEPIKTDKTYRLNKLEFRSRIDILETAAFPAAQIDDYKKLEYNWDEIDRRRLARKKS